MNIRKRGLALLLCLVLCLGVLPGIVWAERPDDSEDPEETAYNSLPPTESRLQTTSSDFSISDRGVNFICEREGFHSVCYRDNTQSSIGYGTKCTGTSEQPHEAGAHSITKEAALAEMRSQINSKYAPRVRTQTEGITMNQNQFDALVSLCYNCGGGTNLIANSPLVQYLKGQLSETEAREAYSSYIVYSGGQVSQGLVNRRNAEADLFFGHSDDLDWATNGTYNWPVETSYPVTAGWYYTDGSVHGGTDFGVPVGTSVYSVAAGTVILAKDQGCQGSHRPSGSSYACPLGSNCPAYKASPNSYGSYANWIIIDHGNNVYSLYAHLKTGSITVSQGDHVNQGQQIAKSGVAGNTTGPHLHFELRIGGNTSNYRVDPQNYLTKQLIIGDPFDNTSIVVNASSTRASSHTLPQSTTSFPKGTAVYINGSISGVTVTDVVFYITEPGGSEHEVCADHGVSYKTYFWMGSGQGTNGYTLSKGGTYNYRIRLYSGSYYRDYSGSITSTVSVTGVTLNKTSLTLHTGNSETLTATVAPSDATNKSVTWSSSNTNVATVDGNGKVTAVGAGSATVTVKTNDGGKTASCAVTVNVSITGVTLNKSSMELQISSWQGGTSETLYATVMPSDATDQSVTWSSSNTNVATVDSNGTVTATGPGSATITVRTNDGGKTASCAVTVIQKYYLDLNGCWNGENQTTLAGLGTADVYVNGVLQANDVEDYCELWPAGTTYEFRDIKPYNGRSYNGIASGARKGTINGDTALVLDFTAINTSGIGSPATTLAENGHIYRYYSDAVTWYTAKQFCEEQGGHLATVTSDAENTLLRNLVGNDHAWLGGTCISGSWKWVTGEAFSFGSTGKTYPWNSVEPNDSPSDEGGENYLQLSNALWNDNAGCYRCGFLFEKEVATYTIQYNANGGSGAPAAQTKTKGVPLTLSSTVPTRSGYSFLGWAESQSATAAQYQPGGSFTKDANTTLYAVWKTNVVSVTGVTLNKTSLTLNVGANETLTATVAPSNATNKSVTWTSSNTGVATVDSNGKVTGVSAGSATITVKTNDGGKTATCAVTVKPKTYTITYDANGGSGAPAAQTKTHGVTLTLSSEVPTRTGYNFKGWAESSGAAEAQYQPGDAFTKNANTTLYAVWKIKTYTVKFDANGGSGAPAAQTKTHGVTLTLSSEVPTRTGYNFKGWAESSSAAEAQYQPGDAFTKNANTTLYAVWKIKTYTVKFNANGGTGAPDAQTKTYGKTLILSSQVPTRSGYTFLGWAESSDATEAQYQPGGNYTKNASKTLYAVWQQADGAILRVGNGSGAPGGTVKIPVVLEKNPGLAYLSFQVVYDKTRLELTGFENGGLSGWTANLSGGGFGWDDVSDSSYNGTALTLVFQIKSGAPEGNTEVKLTGVAAYNFEEATVPLAAVSGSVNVRTSIPGDVNRDQIVNGQDLIRLRKHLIGMNVEADLDAADVTGDETVDGRDLIRLRKYLIGMDVVLMEADDADARLLGEGVLTLAVPNTALQAGETFDVPVSVSGTAAFSYLNFRVEYDKSRLKLVGYQEGALTGWTADPTGSGGFGWDDVQDAAPKGTILTLRFQVLEGAQPGTASVRLAQIECFNFDEAWVNLLSETVGVTISETAGSEFLGFTRSGSNAALRVRLAGVERNQVQVLVAAVDASGRCLGVRSGNLSATAEAGVYAASIPLPEGQAAYYRAFLVNRTNSAPLAASVDLR